MFEDVEPEEPGEREEPGRDEEPGAAEAAAQAAAGEPAAEAAAPDAEDRVARVMAALAALFEPLDRAMAGREDSDVVTGPVGLKLCEVMGEIDLEELTPGQLVDAVAGWHRVVSFAQAKRAEAAALLEEGLRDLYDGEGPTSARRTVPDSRSRTCTTPRAATEVAMRLGITRPAAARIVRVGMLLSGPLMHTGEALEEGRICLQKAEVLAGELDGLPVPLVHDVEDRVLPVAGRCTPPKLRELVAEAVIEAEPAAAAERHRAARERRRVTRPTALPDGMARISAVLPAPDAVALDLALESAARTARAGGDGRTTDQLRADVLASVGHAALGAGPRDAGSQGVGPGTIGGAPVRVHVTMPVTTLLGGDQAGMLEGYGPIDPATARALSTNATIRRVLTDPAGEVVVDVGQRSYRPPAALARLVRVRDGTCTRPGCGVRASACDLDHTVPFAHGGPTALGNLAALCPTDHRIKTAGDFRVVQLAGGVVEWRSPTGHAYRRETDGTITHHGPSYGAVRSHRSEMGPGSPGHGPPRAGEPPDDDDGGEPPPF